MAQENYKKALELEPNSFFPNYNMGVLLSLDRSRHAESIKHLKIALEQAKRAGENLYELNVLINLGLVLEIDGEYDESITHLSRANELDPDNPKIIQKLAQLKEIQLAQQQRAETSLTSNKIKEQMQH